MRKVIVTALFTLLFVWFLPHADFGAIKKLPEKVRADTSTVSIRKFDSNAINKFKADKDFDYNQNGSNAGEPSLWSIFWNWVWDGISGLFRNIPYGGLFLKYLLIALAVALLVYIVFKLLGIDPIKLLQGESKKTNLSYTESLENIHEINFDGEIEKAVNQHNYRLAVRLLYLKCLKQLSDTNLIKWEIDKTNSAYIYELKDASQQQTFGLLTRQFEYVWYGNFSIDQQAFSNINQLFQNFKKQLP